MTNLHRPSSRERGLRLVASALAIAGCASTPRPADRSTATASAPARPADPRVDAGLDALVSQGRVLPDHVGPEAARAIFDDLDRRPGAYLDRIEARFVTPAPGPGYDSLLMAVPLWRLRRHDDARVRRIADRIVAHYRALERGPARADDPAFPRRLADRRSAMELLRDGVDVVAGPRWQVVPASELDVSVAGAPDATDLLRVTRACTCGQPLSCRASVVDGALHLDVRADPDSRGVCTECYAVSTACTLPAGVPGTVILNGVAWILGH